MRFDERVIDQVQAANDIVEVIGQFIPLKRSGRNLKACCPFHQEKTPSFMVQPEKQIFHCFGCGVGGNVFSFLMRYENSNFPEALRRLAERAHIQLPEPKARQGEGPSENDQLYQVYQWAAEYYHQFFLDPVQGENARTYFEKRGFDLEIAKEFKIGWAPDAWRGLFEFLSKKGFTEKVLLKSSLIHRSPKGSCYDIFRGRLLFPIRNLQGKIVAFGGRLLGEGEGPKYLNSPENPIFYKRRELFGLDLAKKFIDRDHPRLLVVEGYFDFLRLFGGGFKTTVATLGTSLTDEHVQLLKRFAEEAIVVYDGDKAGEAASLRGLEVFLEGGMSVKIARVPTGFDPDDFLHKEGAGAFQKIVDEAHDFFDYKLEIMLSRFNLHDSLGLMRITNEFLETFAKVKSPILLDRYLKRLAGSLGVEERSLRTELSKLQKKIQGLERESKTKSSVKSTAGSEAPEEVLLLALMLEEASFREAAFSQLEDQDFHAPPLASFFRMLLELDRTGEKISWPKIMNRLQDEALKEKIVTSFSFDWTAEAKAKAFQDCLGHIQRRRREKRLIELRQNIAKAEHDGDEVRVGGFVREYQKLLRENH